MGYNSEAIPKMVERLRTEHRDFRLELIEIEETSKFIEKLKEIGRLILRHEVEEEARIIQVITEKVKEPERWVKIILEHRGIVDLLEKKISQLEDSSQEVAEDIKTLIMICENISQKRRKLCFLLCSKLFPNSR